MAQAQCERFEIRRPERDRVASSALLRTPVGARAEHARISARAQPARRSRCLKLATPPWPVVQASLSAWVGWGTPPRRAR